ncbi:MAG: hypothetical protein IKA36_06685, partial [Clostridia bacterium]|nr:hypothetical protein [Clostridia bacterium]
MNIDKAYDKMIAQADKIVEKQEAGTLKDKDIDDIVKTLRKTNDAIERDKMAEEIEKMKAEDPLDSKGEQAIATAVYDPETGRSIIMPDTQVFKSEDVDYFPEIDTSGVDIDEILNGESTEVVDFDEAMKFLNSGKVAGSSSSLEDMAAIIKCMKRWDEGDQRNPYNDLPKYVQKHIVSELSKEGLPNNPQTRSIAAKQFVKSLVEEYYMDKMNVNMDSVIKEIADANNELNSKIGMESFNVYKKMIDTSRKVVNGEEAKDKKIYDISRGILAAYDMDDFIDFCQSSKCKIKTFDLQKPQKVYNEFNHKYVNHQNSINNISQVPAIIQRHIDMNCDGVTSVAHLIPIAFCKYCFNFKPDN